MSSPLRVGLDTTDAELSTLHRAVFATMPERFAMAQPGRSADVVLFDCARHGWHEGVAGAVRRGARAIVLRPGPALTADALAAVIAAAGSVPVVALTRYAQDAAWSAAVAAPSGPLDFVDAVVTTPGSPATALFDLAATLLRALPQLAAFELVTRHGGHLVIESPMASPVLTAAVLTVPGPGSQRVDLIGSATRTAGRWSDLPVAAPTEVVTHTASGSLRHPLVYRSGVRDRWGELHRDLTAAGAGQGIGDERLLERLVAVVGAGLLDELR